MHFLWNHMDILWIELLRDSRDTIFIVNIPIVYQSHYESEMCIVHQKEFVPHETN
jgi:hypothetical protein